MKKEALILIIFILSASIVSAKLADSPWPMFHGSVQHGGLSIYDTSHVDGKIKWVFETGYGVEAGIVIGKDDTVYIASHDGYLYAINPDGTEKWRFKAGKQFWDSNYGGQYKSMMATPAIAEDGTIYIYSSAHYLIAVNPDGTEKWRYKILWMPDFWSSPAIGSDGHSINKS
ncbi:MAG: PQQ-binding-like beta-propeller repeat protein [Candidatus Woesearchaeota archaeon]